MDLMSQVWGELDEDAKAGQPRYVVEMMENAADQREKLNKEVERWCKEREV